LRKWFFVAGSIAISLLLGGCRNLSPRPEVPGKTIVAGVRWTSLSWAKLPGWPGENLAAAWPAVLASCASSKMPAQWSEFCAATRGIDVNDAAAQRRLYEEQLRAYRIEAHTESAPRSSLSTGLITGYYEPVLKGARKRGGAYLTPLYSVPDDLLIVDLGELYPALKGERLRGQLQGRRVVPYPDRAQLASGQTLKGKEIVWVDNAIDAFFLQIQGSGRVQLDDGAVIRLAYADVNGHPYRAIGRYLVEHGELTAEQATAPALREWLAKHPDRLAEVLNSNPSVVFFREEKINDPALGPRGAFGVPLTAGRSMAIDSRLLPLGAPIYLSTTHPLSGIPLQRVMVAQDTGGAIRGAVRADVFWGLGLEAAEAAGRMRQQGEMWLLWPAHQPLPSP
jgi:membrane-bound lytic murein transglycosylase A